MACRSTAHRSSPGGILLTKLIEATPVLLSRPGWRLFEMSPTGSFLVPKAQRAAQLAPTSPVLPPAPIRLPARPSRQG
jgi:hypothetical protein